MALKEERVDRLNKRWLKRTLAKYIRVIKWAKFSEREQVDKLIRRMHPQDDKMNLEIKDGIRIPNGYRAPHECGPAIDEIIRRSRATYSTGRSTVKGIKIGAEFSRSFYLVSQEIQKSLDFSEAQLESIRQARLELDN